MVVGSTARAPIAGQSPDQPRPWVSAGGGWALHLANDRSYTFSVAHVEDLVIGWKIAGHSLATETLFAESTYGDADTCTSVTRPCPQIYGLAGGAILFQLDHPAADGTPPRVAIFEGLGIYSVRAPKTGNHTAPALQTDIDMAILREDHFDVVLGIKWIVMPKVRGDFLSAVPFTAGLRLW